MESQEWQAQAGPPSQPPGSFSLSAPAARPGFSSRERRLRPGRKPGRSSSAPSAAGPTGSSDAGPRPRQSPVEHPLAGRCPICSTEDHPVEHTDLFREIFGGCEFPGAQVRKLLAAVAVTCVQDFFKEPERQKDRKARERLERARADAERYIFDPAYLPHGDAFSFETICRAIGIDPDFARRGILAKTPAEVKVIRRRISFHDYDLSDDEDRD